MSNSVKVSVVAALPEFQAKAETLATELGLPLELQLPLQLVVGERLELRETASKTGPVYVDFSLLKRKYAANLRRPMDLIARAVDAKNKPQVLDATAGLGGDAFVMALWGCKVMMLERSPIVFALLRDGLEHAKADPEIAEVMKRMEPKYADAKTFLKNRNSEVIYLDPMYPESGKSAAKRKEMRLFREVVGDDVDVQELFEIAKSQATKRVVIKRSIKAPELAKPSFVLRGTTTRFDVY
ncbi:MAG: class I SAM-dependent methyltransferase [Trueperaceae bacterium]